MDSFCLQKVNERTRFTCETTFGPNGFIPLYYSHVDQKTYLYSFLRVYFQLSLLSFAYTLRRKKKMNTTRLEKTNEEKTHIE